MRVTVAQLDPMVGDVFGNADRIKRTVAQHSADRPDLVVFPELFLVGYPPKDLLERAWFVERVQAALLDLQAYSRQYPETGILLGAPIPSGRTIGKGLYNAAVLLQDGAVLGAACKVLLPTYDVFDEARYFDAAEAVRVVPFKGERLGIHICEDAWSDPDLWSRRQLYTYDPIAALAAQLATLYINISASPFNVGKEIVRYRLISHHARERRAPFLYVNQIGGNDELIFDGRSLCVDREGEPLATLPSFAEHVATIDTGAAGQAGGYRAQDEIASVHDAIILGLRDYMAKTGFKKATLGLSGGIDSALTAYLAAAALGPDNVLGIAMPSPYSSRGSADDASQLAQNLGIGFQTIPITEVYQSYLHAMQAPFAGAAPDVTEENIQARIRGNILMAMSNKFGYLVLATGNKSELSVGYCTLYGDMSGGLAVIADVPKTMVYQLARYANRNGEVIPQSSFDKAPSAELRPNQTDQDTLPPYDILDQILYYYVEEGWSVEQVVAQGFAEPTVQWVARTVNRNEYKRRQAVPGLKVTSKAFGVGRRMPIAARF